MNSVSLIDCNKSAVQGHYSRNARTGQILEHSCQLWHLWWRSSDPSTLWGGIVIYRVYTQSHAIKAGGRREAGSPSLSRSPAPAKPPCSSNFASTLRLNLVGHTQKEDRKRGCLLGRRVPAGEAETWWGNGAGNAWNSSCKCMKMSNKVKRKTSYVFKVL